MHMSLVQILNRIDTASEKILMKIRDPKISLRVGGPAKIKLRGGENPTGMSHAPPPSEPRSTVLRESDPNPAGEFDAVLYPFEDWTSNSEEINRISNDSSPKAQELVNSDTESIKDHWSDFSYDKIREMYFERLERNVIQHAENNKKHGPEYRVIRDGLFEKRRICTTERDEYIKTGPLERNLSPIEKSNINAAFILLQFYLSQKCSELVEYIKGNYSPPLVCTGDANGLFWILMFYKFAKPNITVSLPDVLLQSIFDKRIFADSVPSLTTKQYLEKYLNYEAMTYIDSSLRLCIHYIHNGAGSKHIKDTYHTPDPMQQ